VRRDRGAEQNAARAEQQCPDCGDQAARLRKLEDNGVISRQRYSDHPPRDEYLLTDSGQAITPESALETWAAQQEPRGITFGSAGFPAREHLDTIEAIPPWERWMKSTGKF
jgi:hypothetical protein